MRPDVIVVGAGSAGCVLADRLSERSMSVMVLEAGLDIDQQQVPPGISGPSFFAAMDEPGRIWPELLAQRVVGQERSLYVRGRGVGGSSAVNAMIGLWGEVDDYDSWERDFGCTGWSWRAVEPYFRKIEVPLIKAEINGLGRVGGALIESCRAQGWRMSNGPFPLGGLGRDVGPAMLTRSATGRRVSAADIYLERARRRESVTVRVHCLVDKVIIENGVARGVLLSDGSEIIGGEVVLAAGAIHSPAILLRTGIDRAGIGMGLQDHPSAPITVALREPCGVDQVAATAIARFSSGHHEADLQLLPLDHLGSEAPGFALLSVALMFVHSRGRVSLTSHDPTVDPIVDFNLLDNDQDIEALAQGVQVLGQIIDSRPIHDIAENFFIDTVGTPLSTLDLGGDAVMAWLKRNTGDYVHAAGTCAMGDPALPGTVVDSRGRVVGVQNLRVCDASIFPRVPRANTHFPTMMVAEMIADRW